MKEKSRSIRGGEEKNQTTLKNKRKYVVDYTRGEQIDRFRNHLVCQRVGNVLCLGREIYRRELFFTKDRLQRLLKRKRE
jgi:hypothetical protein